MSPGLPRPKDDEHLDRMLRSEGVARQRQAAVAITVAMALLVPLLVALAGFPSALYFHVLLALFVCIAWAQYFVQRRYPDLDWPAYVFTALNFILLAVTLIYPNPFSDSADYPYQPVLSIRQNNFIFFFIILSALAFSFSPMLLIWGGVCGAVSWSVGRLWVLSRPGVEIFDSEIHAPTDATVGVVLAAEQDPRFLNVGVWIQEVLVFLIISALLALVVQGSRELLSRRAAEERRRVNLSRYLPAQLADRMAEADTPFLKDREANAAIVFTDLVGFTQWAEAHTANETVAMLREIHTLVAEEVFRAEGVLDKFIGDGAMATFGVAKPFEPAARAIRCVEAILARVERENAARTARGERTLPLSVGAHYGTVTIGNVGIEGRLELAVIGDAVNVASRLEALTRDLKVSALVSDDLMAEAGGAPPGWSSEGEQQLPGRVKGVKTWSKGCLKTGT